MTIRDVLARIAKSAEPQPRRDHASPDALIDSPKHRPEPPPRGGPAEDRPSAPSPAASGPVMFRPGTRLSTMLGTERIVFSCWAGEVLAGPVLTLDTETSVMIRDAEVVEVPRLSLTSASDNQSHVLILPADLPEFIRLHADRDIVCHNMAFDYWVVDRYLGRSPEIRDVWNQMADAGKLHCSLVLAKLVDIARHDQLYGQFDLGSLCRVYLGLPIAKDDPYRLRYGELVDHDWQTSPVDPGFLGYAAKDAVAGIRLWTELVRAAEQLEQSHGIAPETVAKWGHLSELVQTRASLALDQMRRQGLNIDLDQAATVRQRLQDRLRQHVADLLMSEVGCAIFRRNKNGQLTYTPSGAPKFNENRIRDYLRGFADRRGVHYQLTSAGKMELQLDQWKEYAEEDELIGAWVGVKQAGKLLDFFRRLGERRVHPKYVPFVRTGRTTCSKPNIQQLPRAAGFREMVVPSPGCVFLSIDYSFIELRTLASVCLRVLGRSRLAEVIREGTDPHCYTAALLKGRSLAEFMELKSTSPSEFKLGRQQAKAVNFGIPGGLGAKSLATYARLNYGVQMTVDDATRFRSKLIDEVYPELGEYLRFDDVDVLSRNLRTDRDEFGTHWDAGGRRLLRQVIADNVPDDVDPETVEELWQSLAKSNRNPEYRNAIEDRDVVKLARMYWQPVVTSTGMIRGAVPYAAAKNTPFQADAAAGAKLALWELHRRGYHVAAFVHDEFVIELPESDDYADAARDIEDICCRSMRQLTGEVPVECEYSVSRCWSKAAEAVWSGGRLLKWEQVLSTSGKVNQNTEE